MGPSFFPHLGSAMVHGLQKAPGQAKQMYVSLSGIYMALRLYTGID